MTDFFLKLVNMSISAGWLILAVMAVRLLLKKGPKWVAPVLWGMVAARLVCPVSVESALSLIPRETVIPETILGQSAGAAARPGTAVQAGPAPSPAVGGGAPVPGTVQTAHSFDWVTAAAVVWLVGVALVLGYALFSYVRLVRRMRTAVWREENVWQSEFAASPFVLGFFRPRIYLPFRIREKDVPCVIAHERAHIARWDHRTKIFGFLLLAVYWFHPLMWAAWLLFCRDLEAACDERVIRDMDEDRRAEYSAALLACSGGQRLVGVCPVAFGELSVKTRVEQVLRYKKPAFWLVLLAVAACVVIAVCFLTDPVEEIDPGEIEAVRGFGALSIDRPYGVVEVTYESPLMNFSVTAQVNTPEYMVDGSGHLFSVKEHSAAPDWTELGGLSEITITKENFDDLFRNKSGAGWFGRESASKIRRNTAKAWSVIYNQDSLYYVLQQNDGELYLAYGYYDYSEKDDPGSDDTNIRWLYKIAPDDTPMAPSTEGDRIADIVDPTKDENFAYDTAMEAFFEDEDNIYYFSGIYSEHVIVHYADGATEDISAALKNGRASIADLDRFGVSYRVEPKAAEPVSPPAQTQPIQPPALSEESAAEFLTAVVSSLRVSEDGWVSFSLPAVFPAAEGKFCDLRINLNATYTESPGVSAVQRLLERKEGWKAGETFEGRLDESLGTVRSVSLWAAFLVTDGKEVTQLTTDYVELKAPFEGERRDEEFVSTSVKGNEGTLTFALISGESGTVRFALPAGLTIGKPEITPDKTPVLPLERAGSTAAMLRLIPFATDDAQTLNTLDPAENTLPMPVFATVAAANHAGYEEYTVHSSTATGACATANYVWQDLTDHGGRAPDAPWQSAPCVLAYDTARLFRFAEIVFAEELLTAAELEELAESIVISG